MTKKEDLLTFFKKNYVLVTIVYLSINIYIFTDILLSAIYLIFSLYIYFLSDNLRIKKYLENKRQNDANLMYHYKNNKYYFYFYTYYL
jgi:hypothetical protein